jgi:anion transporter
MSSQPLTTIPAAPSAAQSSHGWKTGLCIGSALLAYVLARFAPPLAGLTAASQTVLGVVAVGMVLWISEAVPLGVTALLVLALLGINPTLGLPDALVGFTSDVTFFLVGAVALGAAVEASGLAARTARFISSRAGGSPARLYAQLIMALPLLAFLVPSAITRNAILIPAYRDALEGLGIGQSGRAGRALMLTLGMLNPLASSALLTGGIASIAAATLLGGFSWVRWFALMAPPYYLLILSGGLCIRLMTGRFESGAAASAPAAASKPMSPAETKTLIVIGLTSALWLTDTLHGLPPAIPALFAAIMLLCPGIGVLSWKTFESKLSWGLILTVGASISLARAMVQTGAANWLGRQFMDQLAVLSPAPHVLIALLIVSTALIHLAITNLAACLALLLPITATIAQAAGLNPIACGLVVTIAVDAVILYPVQTAANLMAYDSGYFDAADVRRLGLLMLVMTGMVTLVSLPYWQLLGLPLTLR